MAHSNDERMAALRREVAALDVRAARALPPIMWPKTVPDVEIAWLTCRTHRHLKILRLTIPLIGANPQAEPVILVQSQNGQIGLSVCNPWRALVLFAQQLRHPGYRAMAQQQPWAQLPDGCWEDVRRDWEPVHILTRPRRRSEWHILVMESPDELRDAGGNPHPLYTFCAVLRKTAEALAAQLDAQIPAPSNQ